MTGEEAGRLPGGESRPSVGAGWLEKTRSASTGSHCER